MLRDRLNDDLKAAQKARDQRATSTLRMILATLKNRDIEARGSGNAQGIDDAAIADMLQKMIRQREESVGLYRQGGRDDLVRQEEEEIAVIRRYLPQQMGEAEMAAAIDAAIAETGAQGVKDMGRVMAHLKERHTGQMPMAKVGPIVKSRLG